MGKIIDGKAYAASLKQSIRDQITLMPVPPTLAVILVGEDPASQVYVSAKEKACAEAGIRSVLHTLPADAPSSAIFSLIDELNADTAVNGILVQNPLPSSWDKRAVLSHVNPNKDVDCLHTGNIGLLTTGAALLQPCTPAAVMALLKNEGIDLFGKHAVVVGRSDIVGKPLALMMLAADATVTICHRYTKDLAAETLRADVLVSAVGKQKLITADMIKPGCVVIDVGITRLEGKKICGDVDYKPCKEKASAITPVPGGVGPVTIAKLLENCLTAWKIQHG
jgi:methylenetetrahydrofolate dehydrogenase (NADP+)/methenyltetrahydrofolate cyclohydrolase